MRLAPGAREIFKHAGKRSICLQLLPELVSDGAGEWINDAASGAAAGFVGQHLPYAFTFASCLPPLSLPALLATVGIIAGRTLRPGAKFEEVTREMLLDEKRGELIGILKQGQRARNEAVARPKHLPGEHRTA